MNEAAGRAGAELEIDLGAIVDNWRLLARTAAPAACAAVVKANGYGLGAAAVARALLAAGCKLFFVATLDEGIALRRALSEKPPGIPASSPHRRPEIAVLNGPSGGTACEFLAHDLVPVLNEPGQIAQWRELRTTAPAMLQIDTGMARLGLTAVEFSRLAKEQPPIRWRAMLSHLACADDPDNPLNPLQRERFAAAVSRLPVPAASLAASSGIFLGPAYHFDVVRPGAALFGINPQPARPNPLRPVVRLSAAILQVREIDRGESVGYGATHCMPAPGRVATIAVGYADGWLRALSGRGCGYIAGTRVPLIGRVSMDLTTFDVSGVDPSFVYPGACIELIGERHGLDQVAADAGTIGYEILTALGPRYHRVYREPAAG